MAHSFTNLLYHLVFSTKERQPWLEESIRPALWACLGGVIKAEGGIPLHHQRGGGPRPHTYQAAPRPIGVRRPQRREISVQRLDASDLSESGGARLANRIRGVHRQPVAGRENPNVHPKPGRTSSAHAVSGGTAPSATQARADDRRVLVVAITPLPCVRHWSPLGDRNKAPGERTRESGVSAMSEPSPAQFVSDLLPKLRTSRLLFFPIRHHSPACAAHLRRWIETHRPASVLVEGPASFTPFIDLLIDERLRLSRRPLHQLRR